jgi:predicted AAA+ superfamily ATPase
MVDRSYWRERIEDAWRTRPIVWLRGVRRSGKTTLAGSLHDVIYLDCDRPDVRARVEATESFLRSVEGKRVVLDEIHRLRDPSEVLKVAADHFPSTRILATGSSTLQASRKFRDTLTGRKWEVWLVPLVYPDLVDFGRIDMARRAVVGGMPEPFLAGSVDQDYVMEWLDSYWLRDVQELYRVAGKWQFQRLCELLLADSGGVFEATRYAQACELSRQSVMNYLAVLEATSVATVVRPFTTRRSAEIVRAPRVYLFDSGFVGVMRGWARPRGVELGVLWEHVVLNELTGRVPYLRVNSWRTKYGSEVDFVLARAGRDPMAIECKWSLDGADDLSGLEAFRRAYPRGRNLVVVAEVGDGFRRAHHGLDVEIIGLRDLAEQVRAWQS